MMDYQAFVTSNKAKLVAPAGYGKTHTIVECLKHTDGKQLILTHTHAGIASIKEKIIKAKIESVKYSVETISSFAQKYVHAFYTEADIPDQDEKEYHTFVIEKASAIFKSPLVMKVVATSYEGLFVDEYQDCTKMQHEMIEALSDVFPTRILGDPMQGIFDFNGDAVDFENDLNDFELFPELDTPYRWYGEGNSAGLGDILKRHRETLMAQQPITLKSDEQNGLYVLESKPEDKYVKSSQYRKYLDKLIKNPENKPYFDSLLIIVPQYYEKNTYGINVRKGTIGDRAKLCSRIDYAGSLKLIEAIDDPSFYAIAKKADALIEKIAHAKKVSIAIRREILDSLFNKTGLNEWFNKDGLKDKKLAIDKNKTKKLQNQFDKLVGNPSPLNLHNVIIEVRSELKLKYKRKEIYFSILRALNEASTNNIPVYEAIKNSRNTIRRTGRKTHGKCVGTTLLTKGLEFDTVVIIDAHKFECPKHLYVALTRCCKKLIVFTENTTLLEQSG